MQGIESTQRFLDLKRRHPDYGEHRELVEWLWASYTGGTAYEEADALDKYPRETPGVFRARQKRAYLLNYYSAIIDAYVSAVYRRDPAREIEEAQEVTPGSPVTEFPEAGVASGLARQRESSEREVEGPLDAFQDDATGSGVSLTRFMREQTTFALAASSAYCLVDIDSGSRPYVHRVHPANLLDHARDESGELLWALIAERSISEADPYAPRVEEDRYRLWTPQEWILFDKNAQVVDSATNRSGLVPLVEMSGEEVNLPVYDISQIVRRVYNLCSQLDEILINVTFPQMYAPGEAVGNAEGEAISDDVAPLEVGTSRLMLVPEGTSMAPGFLAPPDGPAKLHIEERERLISAVYSLAGLERRDPDSQNVQSGVAKAYDFRETNARLVSLAQMAERAELEIFELVAAYGVGGAASVNVNYQKDFNVRDFAAMLENYLKLQDARIPAAAKRRGALDLSLVLAEEATEEEKKAIRQAVESMPDAEFSETSPGSRTPLMDEVLGRFNPGASDEEGGGAVR